jgi:sec-independent protein translocase protein TatB
VFDIGFTEILLIAIISLLVIGPERLPETVRTIALWIGRFKRSLRETRQEIEQQIGADEIRRELHNEEILRNLEKIRTEVDDALDESPKQALPQKVTAPEGDTPPEHERKNSQLP